MQSLGLLATAAVLLLIGYQCIIMAMRIAEISYVAPFRYTALLWAILLGYLVFGDVPDGPMIAGASSSSVRPLHALPRAGGRARPPPPPARRRPWRPTGFDRCATQARQAPCGIVLAGGRSTRMGGGDKSLELLGGRPLIAHVIDGLRRRPAPWRSAPMATCALRQFGLPVLPDTVPGYLGPLAGLLAGMQWAQASMHPYSEHADRHAILSGRPRRLALQAVRGTRRRLPPQTAGAIRPSAFGRSTWPPGSTISCSRARHTRSPPSPILAMPSSSTSR